MSVYGHIYICMCAYAIRTSDCVTISVNPIVAFLLTLMFVHHINTNQQCLVNAISELGVNSWSPKNQFLFRSLGK